MEKGREDEVDGAHASGEDEAEEDDFNNSALVRRSKRLRDKPVRYRSKSEAEKSLDNGHGDVNGVDRGKRRRSDDVAHDSNDEFDDMYSRVKRARHKKSDADNQDQSASNSEASNDEADKNDSENETEQRRSYSLREQRRMPQRYVAPVEEIRRKSKPQSLFRETPPRCVKKHTYRSPAHRSSSRNRKRHALNGSSSSTSSDSDSGGGSTDEQRFSRRKAKSMAKARSRIMPLNFTKDTVPTSGVLKDRVRAGASLADIDPMEIDRTVTFESVGGLQKHIRTLKEMIVFPLLYPEFYERFKVAPSRGVLFYGPPGTGKTLVARALANECSRGEQRVAFFMRKGADCLSKWVGEAERQLRLLFDKAYEMRPSIIFFDEIDGLAPVRSSRQDQIHSSIVSTLLALMDGIDSRGEIVVIGATNRIDAIDPALRRPGRFDREFHFPLPNVQDRKKILKIHTKHWDPSLRPEFITELAEKCAGYCGADIKCLVTEATQNALRRHYPQIYTTSDKLQLDVASITLTARDFAHALATIIPAAQRAAPNPAAALEPSVRPLLQHSLIKLQTTLGNKFPFAKLDNRPSTSGQGCSNSAPAEDKPAAEMELASDEDEDLPSIFTATGKSHRPVSTHVVSPATFLGFSTSSSSFPTLFRPRMLVSGVAGQGQTVHLAPAALHLVEHLPVHTLSSSTLFAASAKMPEEACAAVFHEAKRTAPSVIYMPYVNELWGVVSDCLRVTFLSLVRGMNPSTPILLFATSETPYRDLDTQLKALFSMAGGEVVEVEGPTAEERRQYFTDLILNQAIRPPPTRKQAAMRVLQSLPKAPPPEPRKLTEREQKKLEEQEEDTVRELRIFLRDILSKLGREKKFSIFTKPVDIDEVPDYYEIIKKPMDLSTIMAKIDLHQYTTASAFMDDIFLICSNALEYNPDRGPTDRAIRHRACALRDTALALFKAELDPEFERICQEITQSRKRRGIDSSSQAPAFYHTRPPGASQGITGSMTSKDMVSSSATPHPEASRFSRRVRGISADKTLSLEEVEKSAQLEKSLLQRKGSVGEDVLSAGDNSQATNVMGSEKSEEKDSTGDASCHGRLAAVSENQQASECNYNNSAKSPTTTTISPSGKNSKARCDTRHISASTLKKISQRKRCPWLATRRRKRFSSTPGQRPKGVSPGSDVEMVSGDEVSDMVLGKRSSQESQQSDHELSPQSAANPENVQLSSVSKTPMVCVTRRSSAGGSGSGGVGNGVQGASRDPSPAVPSSSSIHTSSSEHGQNKPPSTTTSPSDTGNTRTEPARRRLEDELIAVTTATDSGLGSSVESNGDSRDSLEHNNNNSHSLMDQESQDSGAEVDGGASGGKGSTVVSGLKPHRTRARMQDPVQQSALRELESETPSIQVDKDKLRRLLDHIVQSTENFTVERLQKLYSMLSCAVYNFRMEYDKSHLVKEMEQLVERFCRETDLHAL
nr:hypothetical protein BaRGS_023517 [Batillaria attramentaria]